MTHLVTFKEQFTKEVPVPESLVRDCLTYDLSCAKLHRIFKGVVVAEYRLRGFIEMEIQHATNGHG